MNFTRRFSFGITGLSLFSIILLNNSCKKESTPTPAPANGTLSIHLHTNVDVNEVDTYGQVYGLNGGRKITVNLAQMYISNFQLVRSDGSVYSVPNVNVLKVMEVEPYTIGSVPSGNYTSVRFTVGLDSVTDLKVPASNDSTFNQPAMWFGSSAQPSGYVFVNFQGTIDTTTAGNGNNLVPFSYKIGTNSNKRTVSMPNENFTVSPNQVQYVHMIITYNKLFNGISLNVNSNLTMNTVNANSSALAKQISNNIPSMFSYEY